MIKLTSIFWGERGDGKHGGGYLFFFIFFCLFVEKITSKEELHIGDSLFKEVGCWCGYWNIKMYEFKCERCNKDFTLICPYEWTHFSPWSPDNRKLALVLENWAKMKIHSFIYSVVILNLVWVGRLHEWHSLNTNPFIIDNFLLFGIYFFFFWKWFVPFWVWHLFLGVS